ncbi:hypothetical protein CN566_28325 [Bacillus wiedmannii]|uniref:hypothetical protein n=1 Tax=Bacillus wiedmannii TaxID=1890302 RepID=UPI000BF90E3B|nr:hypothetical protein [Bacillus wiedmannii]PEP21712.1 hypothetical protein CN566_28325 [Bacillus wiedmannii]
MAEYRKKPVVVEAIQWFKGMDIDGVICMKRLSDDSEDGGLYKDIEGNYWHVPFELPLRYEDDNGRLIVQHPCWGWIETLGNNSGHVVHEGDYIITGVGGENYPIYPIKEEVFLKTYEPVDDVTSMVSKEMAQLARVRAYTNI